MWEILQCYLLHLDEFHVDLINSIAHVFLNQLIHHVPGHSHPVPLIRLQNMAR